MNRRNKGFTLFELNLSSVITLLIFVAVISLYISVWRNLAIGNTYLDSYAGSRNASGWLMRDIRCAAQVVKQYPETGSAEYQTGDHVIVLKVPSIDGSGNVIDSFYDHIVYALQGSDLYRIVHKDASSSRPNESRVVARYCTSLTFRSGSYGLKYYADNDTLSTINTVSVYLPINKSNVSLGGTEVEKINPTTVIRLRNKSD